MTSIVPWKINRELLVKEEGETDPRYGCIPEERPIKDLIKYGVINLDKPSGPTSHEVVVHVKRILKVGRAGHAGTLDPPATGVLPIALENATKALQALMYAGKEYVCVAKIHREVEREVLEKVIKEFTGKIYQRPPARSAVKRELRIRTIYYADLIDVEGKNILIKVGCEAGTYVRKLCHDIGEALGCGAHMIELRRIRVGPFVEDDSVTLQDLAYAFSMFLEKSDEHLLRKVIKPVEKCFELLPKVYIKDSAVDAICHGAKLTMPGILKLESGIKKGDIIVVLTLKGEAVALMKSESSSEDMLELDKGIAASPLRVIMAPNTYPRKWH